EKRKKIWIFAGESSGDAFGAELAKSLSKLSPEPLFISGMGGEKMRSAGVEIMVDSTELGVVGFVEVFSKIFTFIKIFKYLVKKAVKEQPDAVVLIDYPGFNIRFAKEMKKRNINVVWYVSPQVWAWGKRRIPKLAEYCRKMLVIFPFEKSIFMDAGLDTDFVGHPLVDIVKRRTRQDIKKDKNLILILPGSRYNEVNRLFWPMLETALELSNIKPELKFAVSLNRKSIQERCLEIYKKFKIKNSCENLKIDFSYGETDSLMQKASTGIAASGTVTVESAIAGLPLVVVYKLNPITFFLGKLLVKLPYFTMVNIICGELVFMEFLQKEVNKDILSKAVLEILPDGPRRAYVERKMNEMVDNISFKSESASDNAANEILKIISV
ncbi:MAG TPA: lipid-A-disaccharide synthase, partial [Victivallales bacterium]|nr:lipid-A-disaccharide synthase [Victivallales bacterium]